MVMIEQMAQAALNNQAFELRCLVHIFLRQTKNLTDCPPPETCDKRTLAVAAGLVELFASRQGLVPPAWAASIGPSPEPVYLVASALKMRNLRLLCETESPAPLMKRHLYAPPNYLEFA